MYFVMTGKYDTTIAMTQYKDIAEKIAETFTNGNCIIRWSSGSDEVESNKLFYTEKILESY